jgi:hypothetical protein
MQRPIKFRAWDGRLMLEWDYIKTLAPYRWEELSKLMQYTGLKDKNGVKIYEGDLLAMPPHWRWPVVFQDGVFGLDKGEEFPFPLSLLRPMSAEVVGNIYESPQLMESSDDAA